VVEDWGLNNGYLVLGFRLRVEQRTVTISIMLVCSTPLDASASSLPLALKRASAAFILHTQASSAIFERMPLDFHLKVLQELWCWHVAQSEDGACLCHPSDTSPTNARREENIAGRIGETQTQFVQI
jgi:hypothetical protein